MSGHTQDAGRLGDVFPAHKSGKKFATWTFHPGDGGQPVAVEVYLVGSSTSPLTFEARAKELRETISDPNIASLRAKVEEALVECQNTLTGTVWEDWLEIVTGGSDTDFGDWRSWSTELRIRVNKIKRGVTSDGRVVTRHANDSVAPFPEPVKMEGSGSKTRGGYVLADAAERAYVRDTPQVREALRDVFDRVADLRSRLAQALSNEAVSAALKAGGTVALLPVKA